MQKTQRNFLLWMLIFSSVFYFLYLIKGILLPFVLGILIAYFFNPLCSWLEKKKLPRAASAACIILSFFVLCGIILTALIPILYEQTMSLIELLPSYIKHLRVDIAPQLQHYLNKIGAGNSTEAAQHAATNFSDEIGIVASNIITGIMKSGSALINLVSLFIITPMVGFYLLRDWEKLCAKADNLLPRKHAATIREQLSIINRTIAGFVRGQINMCLILSAYYAIMLSLLGLNFAFAIGIFAGTMLIIPMIGTLASASITLAVSWFQFGTTEALLKVMCVFAVGMLIDNIFTPKLVGEKVGLHPVWIIFGMFCGAVLFGFVGVLLAIPLSAVIGVVVRFSIQQYLESDLYEAL